MNLYSKCRCSTNKTDDEFVGFRFDGDVSVIFPVGYNIPQNERELRKDILLLLKSFSLTDSDQKERVDSGTSYLDSFAMPINSYFWLIKDYINNGLYENRERIIKQNSHGKINWKKTIQKTKAVVSNNGFVYMEPYFELTKNTETLITEIEKYCLRLANTFFGWLFGEIRVPKSAFSDSHIAYMQSMLKKELLVSYTDYKKTLITHMYNILTGLDDDMAKSKVYSYGTKNYNVVWQGLINDVFGNVDVSKFYPTSTWNLSRLGICRQNSSLQQDTIYHDSETDKYYILDAKYYGAYLNMNENNLPATADIEKQITYGEELRINKGIDPNSIYNALILPYNKSNNRYGLNKDVEFIGVADTSWVEKEYPYENVELLFADTEYVMKAWKKASSKDVQDLMEIIEENSVISED